MGLNALLWNTHSLPFTINFQTLKIFRQFHYYLKKKKARTRINAYTMYILPHPLRIEEMSKHQFTTCELGSNDQIKKWGDG